MNVWYLFVVINRNGDGSSGNWLVISIVEAGHIGMLKSFLCSEALLWVELQQLLHEVQCVWRCIRKHVAQLVGITVGPQHGLHHGLGILGVHCLYVLRRRHTWNGQLANA